MSDECSSVNTAPPSSESAVHLAIFSLPNCFFPVYDGEHDPAEAEEVLGFARHEMQETKDRGSAVDYVINGGRTFSYGKISDANAGWDDKLGSSCNPSTYALEEILGATGPDL